MQCTQDYDHAKDYVRELIRRFGPKTYHDILSSMENEGFYQYAEQHLRGLIANGVICGGLLGGGKTHYRVKADIASDCQQPIPTSDHQESKLTEKDIQELVSGYAYVVGCFGPDSDEVRKFREANADDKDMVAYFDALDRVKRRFGGMGMDKPATIEQVAENAFRGAGERGLTFGQLNSILVSRGFQSQSNLDSNVIDVLHERGKVYADPQRPGRGGLGVWLWKGDPGPATAEQPAPKANNGPAVWDLVLADMAARDKLGEQRYGVRLQPHNGRDMLRDALEEAVDLVVYLRGAIYERDGK